MTYKEYFTNNDGSRLFFKIDSEIISMDTTQREEYNTCKELLSSLFAQQTKKRHIREYALSIYYGEKNHDIYLESGVRVIQEALESASIIQSDTYAVSVFITRHTKKDAKKKYTLVVVDIIERE